MGLSSHRSASAMRTRASSARWRGSLRKVAPWRCASSSSNWNPALCRVRAYSVPGFPSPTISLSGSPGMLVYSPRKTPPAAVGMFRRGRQCRPEGLVWRLFLAALLLGRSSFLLLLALLGVRGWGGRRTWSARRARDGRRCPLDRRGGSLGGHRLRLLGARRVHRDYRRIALRELGNRDPGRQADV